MRREEVNAAILARAEGGATIKEIVRDTDQSRGLVRNILRGVRIFSAPGRVHWSRIFRGSMRNGLPAVAMALSSGDVFARPDFEDRCVSSPKGRSGGGARKGWTRWAFAARLWREPSRVS